MQVVQRKFLLVAKTVDPEKLGAALTQVSAGSLAVIASLKLTFARTLSLGASLGNTLNKPVSRKLTPIFKVRASKREEKIREHLFILKERKHNYVFKWRML